MTYKSILLVYRTAKENITLEQIHALKTMGQYWPMPMGGFAMAGGFHVPETDHLQEQRESRLVYKFGSATVDM